MSVAFTVETTVLYDQKLENLLSFYTDGCAGWEGGYTVDVHDKDDLGYIYYTWEASQPSRYFWPVERVAIERRLANHTGRPFAGITKEDKSMDRTDPFYFDTKGWTDQQRKTLRHTIRSFGYDMPKDSASRNDRWYKLYPKGKRAGPYAHVNYSTEDNTYTEPDFALIYEILEGRESNPKPKWSMGCYDLFIDKDGFLIARNPKSDATYRIAPKKVYEIAHELARANGQDK